MNILLGMVGTLVPANFFAGIMFLATDQPLTDLFYTEAFSGSWEVFSKFNFLGYIMQFFISAICLLALFLIAYQRLMSLFYLSARPLFDKVHEIKQQGKGQKFLGLPALAQNTLVSANHGTGLDAIVSFLLSLLPDVKAYSDYNEERMSYNLQEDDTCTTYMLKVAIPTIMLIFFFSIGFNGTLFKAYGNVVDAMGTAADNLVETDLASGVQKLMNTGKAYSFGYSADGTEWGSFRQNLVKDMYAKVLKKTSNLSTESKLTIGKNIEAYVNKNLPSIKEGSDSIGSYQIVGFKGTDSDCSNLQYSVVVNGTPSYDSSVAEVSGKGIPLSDFGITDKAASNYYMHIFISKKNNADETDYFQDVRETTGGGTAGGSSGSQNKPTGQK